MTMPCLVDECLERVGELSLRRCPRHGGGAEEKELMMMPLHGTTPPAPPGGGARSGVTSPCCQEDQNSLYPSLVDHVVHYSDEGGRVMILENMFDSSSSSSSCCLSSSSSSLWSGVASPVGACSPTTCKKRKNGTNNHNKNVVSVGKQALSSCSLSQLWTGGKTIREDMEQCYFPLPFPVIEWCRDDDDDLSINPSSFAMMENAYVDNKSQEHFGGSSTKRLRRTCSTVAVQDDHGHLLQRSMAFSSHLSTLL